MRKLAFRELSGRGLWVHSGSFLGRAPPETLCEPAEALDGAPNRRSRKWRAAMQFHSPDMDFQLRVPRLLVHKKTHFYDLENHALLCRLTHRISVFSLNNDTQGDTKKHFFRGAEISPCYTVSQWKTTISQARAATKNTQNVVNFGSTQIAR